MKKGGEGGNKTITGINFEIRTDISNLFNNVQYYKVQKNHQRTGLDIYFNGKLIARCFKKYEFYRFLEEKGVKWKEIVSTKLLPDSALLVLVTGTIYIIEVKYQEVQGSTDEKLQTCDFKKRQYEKLVAPLKLKVEFVYLLNRWFEQEKYRDVFDYIKSVGCHYFFEEIPFAFLGLPSAPPSFV